MNLPTTSTGPDLAKVFGPRGEGFLPRCLAALRQALPVEEVWLFGSCVRGEARPDSDLDLLVVLADDHGLTRPGLACYRTIRRLHSGIPMDVMAVSKSRWEQECATPFGLFGEVWREGVQVYANRSEKSPALV
ncbi:MAG TPA: nucleotidyltransferase domain-containing protein [Verrucomicrobiae bacterium]